MDLQGIPVISTASIPDSPFGDSFQERLRWVLAGRDKHPWGRGLNLGKNLVSTMFDGTVPKWPTLAAIQYAENARVDWLLTGRGTPFAVAMHADAASQVRYLEQLLADEPGAWHVHVVHDGVRAGAVLWQPMEIESEDLTLSYRSLEVVLGPAGVVDLLRAAVRGPGASLECLALSTDDVDALYAGRLGTWLLLGDSATTPGLLMLAEQEDPNVLLYEADQWVADVDAPRPAGVPTPRERELLRCYRALSARRQRALLDLLDDDGPPADG